MTIRIINKKGELTVIHNRLPSNVKFTRIFYLAIILIIFGITAVYFFNLRLVFSELWGFLFLIATIFAIFVSMAFLSGIGSSKDILFDAGHNSVTIGDTSMSLKDLNVKYSSAPYQVAATNGWGIREVMRIVLSDESNYQQFSTYIDTFIELKDELQDQLGIKMKRG